MPRVPAKIRPMLPFLDMRQRVEANRMGQAKLRREISALGKNGPKSEAQRQLTALQTELMALNMEMHMRTGQVEGNA
jgi:hypothetical protein